MNLKENLLNFISDNENRATARHMQIPENYKPREGLCPTCRNIPHCIWAANTKLNCEHYE